MVTCLVELHTWTLKNQTIIPDDDIGCFTYHEKNEPGLSLEQPYSNEKAAYTESRDATWIPRNKRPERLRDTLREVEEILGNHKCIRCHWLTKRLFQAFLANGTLVTFMISLHTGDVDKIFIDKTLVGKLSSESPSDVLITDSCLVVAYPDRSKLDYIYFTKQPSKSDTPKKVEKLSLFEPKIIQTELPGPVGRRLDRRLSCNVHQDLVLTWWPSASEEAWPWSPMTGERERANMVLFAVNGNHLDTLCYTRTESDPLGISFSTLHPHQLLTVEQCTGSGSEISAEICMYEINRNKIQRLTVTSVPLKSNVICESRNSTEDKVLLGCEDMTLVLYDEYKKVTSMTSAALVPHCIRWHPSGTVVIVASLKGEIQVLDMALAPLLLQRTAETLSPTKTFQMNKYFRSPPTLDFIEWCPQVTNPEVVSECTDYLLLVCDRGPFAVLQYYLGVYSQGQLSPLALVNQYVKYKQIDQAVNVLCGLNWNVDGHMCFACLSMIVNHLLRMPLSPDREAQLEAALGTFYAPPKPLSDVTVLEYRDPASRLARRFFHHLLRFTRFDKAFLLAVDIGARDLFMDIHYVALDKGETALAEVARRKADQIDVESLATDSAEDYEDNSDDRYDSLDDSYEEDGPNDPHSQPPPPRPPRWAAPSLGKPPPPAPNMAMMYQNAGRAPHMDGGQRPQQQVKPWEHSSYMYMPEAALQQLEEELSTDLFTEYTAALLDEIPPPQMPPDGVNREPENTGDSSVSGSVKVIHFGIV